MTVEELERQFREAEKTTEFSAHVGFTDLLLSSNEPEVLRYHLSLLDRRENHDLYQRVRAVFQKRGPAGEAFLISLPKVGLSAAVRVDVLLILGWMRSEHATRIAREAIASEEDEYRKYGCVVLGWVGSEEEIPILEERLLSDRTPPVRGMAATAMRQIWFRIPETKGRLLSTLREALSVEEDEEVQGLIVVCCQDIAGKRFGLKEDWAAREILGDVSRGRDKALKYLDRFRVS